MKPILFASALLALHATAKPVVDVAGGNHQTVVLTPEGHVLTFGQDLHIPTAGGKNFIGGKLGRPIDKHVLPGKDPESLPAQANYNPVPAKVVGLDGLKIASVSMGQNDAAAITEDGAVYLWGPNNHGQLGLGDTKERREATLLPLPDGGKAAAIDFGGAHTLVLTTAGKVFTIGSNSNGQLGLGDKEKRLTPTLVKALAEKKIIQVAAGQNTHSLFLADDGTLFTCGSNTAGQLGLGEGGERIVTTPTPVPGGVKFKFVAVGVKSSFAISEDGKLYGTGDGSKGHFGFTTAGGDADLKDLSTFTLLPNAPTNLVQVAAGSRHVATLNAEGRIHTWGIHSTLSAQLGIGAPKAVEKKGGLDGIYYPLPQAVTIPGGIKATKINSLANNVFCVGEDNKVYGWGQTAHGRLGYGITAVHSAVNAKGKTLYHADSPVEIPMTDDASKIKLAP